MFENPRRGRQERKFTTNVPKILDLKFRTDIDVGCPWFVWKTIQTWLEWRQGCFSIFPRRLRSLLLKYTAENSRVTQFWYALAARANKKKKPKKRTVFVFTESWPRDQLMHKAYWRYFSHIAETSSKFGWQWLVMMNYVWVFSQSEMEKYFEWMNEWIIVAAERPKGASSNIIRI